MNFSSVLIQSVQDFWNKRPCNIFHSPSKFGTKKYFDEVEKRKYFVEPHIPQFAQFSKWKNKKVLEIGCGIGTDTINFARAGAKITAIELSSKSLEVAKKRAKVFNLENNIKFYLADAENLSQRIPISKYDLIYSFGVIHHSPHPKKILEEIKKFTDKKTIIKIMIYYRFSWKVLWVILKYGKGAFWKTDELIAKYSEAAIGSPITYIYSKQEVIKLFNNFKILKMEVDHIFPYSIPEYKKYIYKKVWYFRYLPKVIFKWLENNFGWHLLITAKIKN